MPAHRKNRPLILSFLRQASLYRRHQVVTQGDRHPLAGWCGRCAWTHSSMRITQNPAEAICHRGLPRVEICVVFVTKTLITFTSRHRPRTHPPMYPLSTVHNQANTSAASVETGKGWHVPIGAHGSLRIDLNLEARTSSQSPSKPHAIATERPWSQDARKRMGNLLLVTT